MEEIAYRLDLKDEKIIGALDMDCRQPATQIAKKVGLSTEVVNYRIKKLEQNGIITQYQVAINLSKLGLIPFKVFLCLQHITSEKLNYLIDRVKKNKAVKWIASCKGAWDLVATLEATSLEEVNLLKNEIISQFSGYISKTTVSITLQASAFSRTYKHQMPRQEKVLFGIGNKEKIDEVDMKILEKLSENARKPLIDIAYELKLSERVVNYRIKQLIKRQIITGFRIALDYKKLGIFFYKGFVHLDNPNEEKIKKLIGYFKQNKNIIHNVRVIASWEFEPEFETNSEHEFDLILQDIKDKFSDIIGKVEVITIDKEHKFVYF